jgi:hypothetical protein
VSGNARSNFLNIETLKFSDTDFGRSRGDAYHRHLHGRVFSKAKSPTRCRYVAHLGNNATGFTNFEYGMSGKWLELLKEIAPSINRDAVFRNLALGGAAARPLAARAQQAALSPA